MHTCIDMVGPFIPWLCEKMKVPTIVRTNQAYIGASVCVFVFGVSLYRLADRFQHSN